MPTASVLARLSALSHAQGPCWLSRGRGTVGVARLGCRRLSSLSAKWQCHGCGPRAETKGVPAQGYDPLQPHARMPPPTVLRFGGTSSRPLALNPTPGCQREGKPEPVLRSSKRQRSSPQRVGRPGLCARHAWPTRSWAREPPGSAWTPGQLCPSSWHCDCLNTPAPDSCGYAHYWFVTKQASLPKSQATLLWPGAPCLWNGWELPCGRKP